jgi:acyl dehydratase
MLEFARIWDPVPFHVDEAAGKAAFGSLTAPGIFALAFKQRLIHRVDVIPAVIASLGYDEVRFLKPVRPGDELTLVIDWVEKRPSKSRNDRGVVVQRLSLVNQKDEVVMSHLDTILVRVRPDTK